MTNRITYDEYVDHLCSRRNMTRKQLFAWMEANERTIEPCDCDDFDGCQGWVCSWPTPEEEMAKMGVD